MDFPKELKSPTTWNTNDVCYYFKKNNLCTDEFLALLASNRVDGMALSELTITELRNDFYLSTKKDALGMMSSIERILCLSDIESPFDVQSKTESLHSSEPESTTCSDISSFDKEGDVDDFQSPKSYSTEQSVDDDLDIISSLQLKLESIIKRTDAAAEATLQIKQPTYSPTSVVCSSHIQPQQQSTLQDDGSDVELSEPDDILNSEKKEVSQVVSLNKEFTWDEYKQFNDNNNSSRRWLEISQKERKQYKLTAKRRERIRLYGVHEVGGSLQRSGILELSSRRSLLENLFDEWDQSSNPDGFRSEKINCRLVILGLQVFFYWSDDKRDSNITSVVGSDETQILQLDRRGMLTKMMFVDLILTLTELLPQPEFEYLIVFFQSQVVDRLETIQRKSATSSIFKKLYTSWKLHDPTGIGISLSKIASILEEYTSQYAQQPFDIVNFIHESRISSGIELDDSDVRIKEFIAVCNDKSIGMHLEKVVLMAAKLNRASENLIEKERNLLSAGSLNIAKIFISTAEIRASFLLSGCRVPVLFLGDGTDPAAALESYSVDMMATLKYASVTSSEDLAKAESYLLNSISKGCWFFLDVSPSFSDADDLLRKVALAIETTETWRMNTKFRSFIHCRMNNCSQLLLRKAATITLDASDPYHSVFIIKAGLRESEKMWR